MRVSIKTKPFLNVRKVVRSLGCGCPAWAILSYFSSSRVFICVGAVVLFSAIGCRFFFSVFENSFNEMIGFNWFVFVFIWMENRLGLRSCFRSKIQFAAIDWLNDYFVLAQIKFVIHGHFRAEEFKSVVRATRLECRTYNVICITLSITESIN